MAIRQDEIFERARLARDARFDGRFYVGVRTTGIYCRPVCPANSPKSENVRFFPTAAAASEAGFRPCLRCRPETAPGSPAWLGTSTTVRRGLRLIARGALDDGSVETLAERLGITSRHLRRLFTRHIGASPQAVAHTQRLHFAKRLIDDTGLPMTEIALASGYGSVRRFNDAFLKAYGRSPRALRRVRGKDRPQVDGQPPLTVRLAYRQPMTWSAMLAFFRARAIPGVEAVHGDRYLRSVAIGGEAGSIAVGPSLRDGYLDLTLSGIGTAQLFETVQRSRELFDLDAPIDDISAVLGADPMLAARLQVLPGIRVVGAWCGFELAIRAILGQQISVAAATTLAGRIAARYGEKLPAADDRGLRFLFPRPEKLARARFNGLGLIGSKITTIRGVASAVLDGDLDFDTAQDVDEFCRRFRAIKGIGDWTAQYVAMRVLKHPDAFPSSDLGLLKAVAVDDRPTPRQLEQRAEAWRPWRAYAAALLWYARPDAGG